MKLRWFLSVLAGALGVLALASASSGSAGATAASFTPGNVFVADHESVVEYTPSGAFVRSYGSGSLVQAIDVAFSGARDAMLVTDAIAHDVKVIDPAGTVVGSFGASVLSSPRGLAVGAGGQVYVTDVSPGNVKVFDSAGHFLRILGAVPVALNVTVSPDLSRVLVSESNLFAGVHVFDLAHADQNLGTFGETASRVTAPAGVVMRSDGGLYVGDVGPPGGAGDVKSFRADGSFAGSFAAGVVPNDLALDVAGNLWVTDTNNFTGDQIREFSPTGAPIRSFGSELLQPTGVAVMVAADPAPKLTVPADFTVEATSPAGAVVTYDVWAADAVDPAPTLSCAPASGAPFPIGDTTVTCTATNAGGHATTKSFVVRVRGAGNTLEALIALVRGAGLSTPLTNDLLAELFEAVKDLGKPAKCCHDLDEFVARIFDELGKEQSGLPVATAAQFLAVTASVERALGCLSATSPVPLAEQHTVDLIAAINAMGLPTAYANDVRGRARDVGLALANGAVRNAGVALDGLARKLAADAGKPGKLSVTQAAQLSAKVAQIKTDLGL